MSNRKFRLVTFILLLLLIAAITNTYFIFHAYQNTFDEAPPAPKPAVDAVNSPPPVVLPGATKPPREFIAFDWYGDAAVTRLEGGSYELTAQAYTRGSRRPFDIDSLEIDARHVGQGGSITPKLEKVSMGNFSGRVDFPSSGTWEVRVRMHHSVRTLEFTKIFEIN
ncbi:MAG: hypothetical protein EPN97_03250 [Alphaproteobacteria bacterium]|nr:MAG: hypothetical protein EPN97_03250 [Alphaproteobacteria bacterium]